MLAEAVRRPIAIAVAVSLGALAGLAARGQEVDWPVAGGDLAGRRYSPADEITPANVARLAVAWTYRTGEIDAAFATRSEASFETTPLVVDGIMYVGTPLGRVIALNAETGKELWVFDPKIARDVPYGDFANRGVATWFDPGALDSPACQRRIFIANAQSELYAVDARRGRPCLDFGANGKVDLRRGLRVAPFEPQAYSMTSPPIVVGDAVIVGSSIADNSRPNPASGEVRAYDVRRGRLLWSWDAIPQDPSDPAYREWRGEHAHEGGGANAWSGLAADAQRDLVFVPTGSAAPDYYGGLRLGDNRYANSVVALRASTGRLVWAFQTVHHDLWDYDNAAPPALVTVTRGGREIPAVVQATKTGMLFVLNRETGEPIFPVEERPVPKSDLEGEAASPTQPFTALTPPLSPHRFGVDDVWALTDEDRAACRAAIEPLRNEGIFTPPSTEGTLALPSNIGGAHWGGVAIDERRSLAIVPVNRVAAMVQLIPRAGFDMQEARRGEQRMGEDYEYNMLRGTPYVMRRRLLLSPSRLPCTPPPFGALVAIDLTSGLRKWSVPLGTFLASVADSAAVQTRADFGSPNLGGPIATAGGLVFIGASLDRRLHAYDAATGAELWHAELPVSAKATPMTYRLRSGAQLVAVALGGGDAWGAGDYVIAFRLR
jgi:quinoprotein glucose dehydrogenase